MDAYEWAGAFQSETDGQREARRSKWRELRKCFAELAAAWNGPVPTSDEIAQMVRDNRDERAEGIIASLGNLQATEGRG